MAQMRTDLGLVWKHVTKGEEKDNAVNYLSKPPPPTDEYYYKEDSYVVNEQTEGFWPNAQGSNRKNGAKVKEIKVKTVVITIERVIMSEMGITTATTTSTGVTMVTKMIGVGPMFHLKIKKFLLGMVEVV